MARVTVNQLADALEQLQAQMTEISRRLDGLEAHKSGAITAPPAESAAPAPVAMQEPASAALTQEQLLAIAAAIGAFLGVRVHIRQIRLVSSGAWSQQGRVSIQASHTLHA